MTRVLGGLLVVALASFASTVRAAGDDTASTDPAQEARQQYQAGMQAYQAKRFVEAALHFEAAAAQKPHAVTLYTAALAWEQANRPERAADDFVRALDVPGPGLSASQTQNAHDRLANLEKTMGTLEVIAPDGWRVQIDSNTEVNAPAHLHALPGVHALASQGATGPVQHRDVTIEAGKTLHVEVTPAPPPASTEPKSEPTSEPNETRPEAAAVHTGQMFEMRRVVGVGVAGVGAGALGAGIILGVNALSARDAYNAAPSRAGYDHASGLATWTDVALIAGGVLVAGGVALAIWPSPKPKAEPTVSLVPLPTGAVLRGVF
jgi:hypothetical protein